MELIFSRKKIKTDHPQILFNNTPVMKVDEHKHLGIILDSKLSIKSAISKSRKGIGLLKYLPKYLLRHTLDELCKLYVRPHLDYRDVIYHVPSTFELNGKIRARSVFCWPSNYGNLERNITRKAVHRTWLGIIKMPTIEQTPYFVLQDH